MAYSIHLSVNLFQQTSRELLLKIICRKKNTGKCIGSLKHDWTLSGTATSLHFFLNSFSSAKSSKFMCLPTHQDGFQNRDKVYTGVGSNLTFHSLYI